MKLRAVGLAVAVVAGVLQTTGAEGVVASGATLQKLAGDFAFTEGPTADAAGNVFFTDQPNNRILKWSVDGHLSTFLQPAGRANGMCFDPHGDLLVCADENTELWRISAKDLAGTGTPSPEVLLGTFAGQKLNGPNDVWAHPNGSLYFTDPFYKRPWWTWTKRPQDGEHVYWRSADGQKVLRVVDSLKQPNGIVGTADGKTLLVADIGAGKTYRFKIGADGALTEKTLFCELGSDGMTLDAAGNVYLTGKGVDVFSPEGKPIETIDVPEGPANLTFGGPDKKTLFITASKGLYSIRTQTRGNGPGK